MADSGSGYKVILLGDAEVGKTHIAHRFARNAVPETAAATIGLEFSAKEIQLEPGVSVRAMVWDTAGQERFRSITTAHFRQARGALIVYDITKRESFESTSKWADDLKKAAEVDCVICLIGNKADLGSQRKVPTSVGEEYARKQGFLFFETSSKTGQNVHEAFKALLTKIHQLDKKSLDAVGGAGAGVSFVGGARGRRDLIQKNYNNELKGGLRLTEGAAAQKQNTSCCGDEDEAH